MRIAVCLSDTKPEPWLEALQVALPGAQVQLWSPGLAAADHAVVWAPPQQFVDEQPRLKAMFNIGAGVDAIMKLRLPPGLQVVRLDDAGMSVQMAEYVCHALIRHFREFDVYESEARQGRWVFRKPLERADFPVGIMGLGVLGERVARAVRQFEFPVLGWSRTPKAIDGVRTFAGEARLGDFLVATRVLVNLLPLTDATRGILNRTTLSALRPGGYLIHIARGGHLVEEDLIPLIDSGRLAGAALLGAAALALGVPLAQAHHGWSWADGEQTTLDGTVHAVSMAPPHPMLQVKAADGALWQVDLGNPSQTERSGFTGQTTKAGDAIRVLGNRHKDHARLHMKAVRITVGGTHYDMYPERLRN